MVERSRLLEKIPAVVYVLEVGEPSRTVYCGPQIEAMLGYPPDAYEKDRTHWIKVLHPDDRERILAEDARAGSTGEPLDLNAQERDRGEGPVVLVKIDHFSHVYVGECVSHDDHEGLVEAGGEALYAAGRAHEFLLAGEVDRHAVYPSPFSVEAEDGVG
jgi:PAS domain-containing protein